MAQEFKADEKTSMHGDSEEEEEQVNEPEANDNVARILKQLQSTGALIKKPKQELRCQTCDLDFKTWSDQENHLLQHVSLPSIILEKIQSEDEFSDEDDWSGDETMSTPQKLDISQIMNKTGLQIKKADNSNLPLDKLSGLGIAIKKSNTPIKEEKPDAKTNNNTDILQKLGNLGGLKLKLKSEGGNGGSFKVVNGLKDFNTSEDEHASGDDEEFQSPTESDAEDDNNEEESPKSQNHEDTVPKPQLVKIETEKENPPNQAVKRPAVKQTPKRDNGSLQITPTPVPETVVDKPVEVKKEVDDENIETVSTPLFNQIKTERTSPPLADASATTPMTATVKTENYTTQPSLNNTTVPLMEVTKKEPVVVDSTVIEINGDSNDEDDDCCVVSTTPAPDIKPKVEVTSSYQPPAYSSATNTTTQVHTASTERQHSFNWNAPDSKPPIDMLEKSADDIFESLLASSKTENHSISDSEYISLDTLGPQHSCDVCNTRFTSLSMLEQHIRTTGHSKSVVAPTSSNLLPYSSSSYPILSNLLPVSQLAEQVGKLSTISSASSGFTHQQNVMINIQAYPGAGGMMPPPPAPNQFNAYGQQQPNFPQGPNLYGNNPVPGQYPGQYVSSQGYNQSYPNQMHPNMPYPPNQDHSQFPTQSPLQSMQQTVYGQQPGMMTSQSQPGSMGPPMFIPSSGSLSTAKQAPTSTSAIRIQNVQTFAPGQFSGGQQVSGASPNQVRGQGPQQISGIRPRMPVKNVRPSIRPGMQIQGSQARAKIRMPMKRPMGGPGGPAQKRRPDVLLPGRHDNEDCQVMSMQKQREGMPMIHSVQGAKDKLNLGSQISITKKVVNKEANAMANVLASRGISIKQKQKSRSPTPERPIPHIPNLGAGVSIKATSKSSSFSIPEAKVGGAGYKCRVCNKMFMNHNSLNVHMSTAHPNSSLKCEECPAIFTQPLLLTQHKRTFHNVSGSNREMGLPVVDFSRIENIRKLTSLGIHSFVPLASRDHGNGTFGIPIISVSNMQNGVTNSLKALGADGLLSLGPLKPLPD